MRVKKTRQDQRGVYRYPVDVPDGRGGYRRTYTTIKPGEEGVTEVLIHKLHRMDDNEVTNKRDFNEKYNSTLEERIKKTPKGNTIRGMWTGDRGESWYIPADKSIIAILHVFELDGILYREGIPDFSVCAKVTVSIENMSEIRRDNFQQCDVKCAEKWSREKYEGKSKWISSDVKRWRKENGYTWHERNDMVICDLVPTKINKFFGHLGGVSECKKCRVV